MFYIPVTVELNYEQIGKYPERINKTLTFYK